MSRESPDLKAARCLASRRGSTFSRIRCATDTQEEMPGESRQLLPRLSICREMSEGFKAKYPGFQEGRHNVLRPMGQNGAFA